jgi:hypothetical protein
MAEWDPTPPPPEKGPCGDTTEVPEGDRRELRRMAAFLRWRKERALAREQGREAPAMPPEMRDWCLGRDAGA